MFKTIFFLISSGFKRQSFPQINVKTGQKAQIKKVVNCCLNGPLLYHKSVDFDDLDFKCILHFRRYVIFGYCNTRLVHSWY